MAGERGSLASSHSGPGGTNPTAAGSCTTSIQPSLCSMGEFYSSHVWRVETLPCCTVDGAGESMERPVKGDGH